MSWFAGDWSAGQWWDGAWWRLTAPAVPPLPTAFIRPRVRRQIEQALSVELVQRAQLLRALGHVELPATITIAQARQLVAALGDTQRPLTRDEQALVDLLLIGEL